MRAAGVRRAPVLDAKGALRGLLSFDDILGHVQEEIGALTGLLGRERRHEETERR